MFKIAILVLLLGLLQPYLVSSLKCDKTDMIKCSMEINETLTHVFVDAYNILVKTAMRERIIFTRELQTECNQDQDCKLIIDKQLHELKINMEKLEEHGNNDTARMETLHRVEHNLNTIENVKNNVIQKLNSDVQMEKRVEDAVRDFIEEIWWHVKEMVIELKEKDIKIDALEKGARDMRQLLNRTGDLGGQLMAAMFLVGNMLKDIDIVGI